MERILRILDELKRIDAESRAGLREILSEFRVKYWEMKVERDELAARVIELERELGQRRGKFWKYW